MHKTSQIPSKMALGRGRFGAIGGAKAKTAPPGGNWFFGDFLIIFDVAFFSVKIQARAQNIVNTVKK